MRRIRGSPEEPRVLPYSRENPAASHIIHHALAAIANVLAGSRQSSPKLYAASLPLSNTCWNFGGYSSYSKGFTAYCL